MPKNGIRPIHSKQPRLITDVRSPLAGHTIYQRFMKITKRHKKIIAVVLFVTCTAIVVWRLSIKPATPDSIEMKVAITNISRHILLPKDEEPTFAVVKDKNILKDPFLASKAENNDQVLIYGDNSLAIVYRPKIDRIVAVGTITADLAIPEAEGTTIIVLNGTANTIKTQSIIDHLKTLYPQLKVIGRGNANKQDFPATIIIDNTNKKDELVEALSKALPGKRGVVPISEATTNSDLMIIVGKD